MSPQNRAASLSKASEGAARFKEDPLSADGDFLFVNEAFASILGYSSEDLIGKPITWLHPPAEAGPISEKFALLAMQKGATANCHCSLRAKSGQLYSSAIVL